MGLNGGQGALGEDVFEALLEGGGAGGENDPVDGKAGGLEDATAGGGDFGTDAVTGDQNDGVLGHERRIYSRWASDAIGKGGDAIGSVSSVDYDRVVDPLVIGTLAERDDSKDPTSILLLPALALPAIWLLAFLVRLFYLMQVRSAPSFDLLMGDAEVYDAWARQIAAGDWIGKTVFYQAPLYPYLLGAWYALAGTGLWGVRIVQIMIGATSCSLLAAAGCRFFSPLVGFIAGVMLALYSSAIFFDALIQKTVLDNFLIALLALLLSCVAIRPRRAITWLAIGISLGCLALTRENALVLPILIVAWLLVHFRDQSWQNRARWGGLLILGMAALLLPTAWRNHHVGGGLELTTSQWGTNLYIGNNAGATGSYVPMRAGHGNPVYERREATELAEQASGRRLTAGQVSAFWSGKAFAFMREHPVQWLTLMGKKIWLTWSAYEISDTDDQYFLARWSWLLRGLGAVFHFGVICPLAAIGIVLWPDRHRVGLLYLLLAGYSLSVAVFYVFARYRYPLAPIVLLFTAAGVFQLVERLRRAEYRKAVVAGAIGLTVAVVVNWPSGMHNEGDATTLYNVGVAKLKQGQLVEAADYSKQALQLEPAHWGAHNTLGRVLAQQGHPDQAIQEFRAALKTAPESADLHNNLGNALDALGRLPEAEAEFRRAIQLDPGFAEAHNGLGVVFAQEGNPAQAAQQFRKAMDMKPDYADAKRNFLLAVRMQGG